MTSDLTDPARFAALAEPRPYDAPYRPDRSAAGALLGREVRRYVNIWKYAVVGPVLASALFVVVFGSVLSRHIDALQGVPYGQFIVPGLLVQAIVNVGFYNGTTSIFEARRDGYINDVFASPLHWWEITGALALAAVIRGVLTGALVLAIALPLTGIGVARPLYLVLALAGVLVVAAQVGVIAGSLATSLDHVYWMDSVVLLPLAFLGGIFYSVAQLPHAALIASHANPVFWLVQATRIGFLDVGDVPSWLALTVVWAAATALSAWAAQIFRTGYRLKP